MEEGSRKLKSSKRFSTKNDKREMYERRPLKTVVLSPPDYAISPQILLDSYTEKEISFAGIISDVPVALDATNRTEVLRVIDKGKREEKIPWRVSHENDAIFCINVHNVKISARDGKEESILRVPIHEIQSVVYIRDDSQHIVSIKYGEREDLTDVCQMAIIYCDSRATSEELCSVVGQCFQLVFTEATMQFLDTKLFEAASIMSNSTTTTRSDHSNMSTPVTRRQPYTFFSGSQVDLDQQGTVSTSLGSRSLPRTSSVSRRRSSNTASDSDYSVSASELLQDYTKKLHTKMNPEELRRFATYLKAMHTNMPFSEFCDKVLELYGPDRKYLLVGMRPFIPEAHYSYFETFLERIGVTGTWSETASSGYNRRYRRTISGASAAMDEYDRRLSDISADIENLETSVDMNNIDRDNSFLPKST